MKKLIGVIICIGIIGTVFVGCGKKDFKPELAPLNQVLRTTEYNNIDGSYPTINIESVTKDNDSIVIKTLSPFEDMLYAKEKFITFKFYNSKGDSTDKISYKLEDDNNEGEFVLKTTAMNINDIKYVEVGPYKFDSTKKLIYEVR